MSRVVAPLAVVVVLVGVLVAVAPWGGEDRYLLRMELPSAYGLRSGSAVKVAGAPVGEVASLELDERDNVDVELALEDGARAAKGVRVAIRSANLLGEKFVELDYDRGAPALPSGSRIAASRVTTPVDLDQVLGALDADTRTRLAILVNETGVALTGRRTDLNAALEDLPPAFDRTTALLEQVGSDNESLGRLVDRSSGFVARLARERAQLTRLVGVAGEGMTTVAARRAELRETLRRAPGTLARLRELLADVRRTTVPLRPAAQALSATAPALRDTLSEIGPFRRVAAPTLADAEDAAPLLARLGREATPAVRRGVPTARALATFAERSGPATQTLDAGIDDLMGTVQGWARAIQGRDSIGHLFRGHLNVGSEAVASLLERLGPAATTARKGKRGAGPAAAAPAVPALTPAPSSPSKPGASPVPELPSVPLPKVVDDALGRLLPQAGVGRDAPSAGSTEQLLDFLLGS